MRSILVLVALTACQKDPQPADRTEPTTVSSTTETTPPTTTTTTTTQSTLSTTTPPTTPSTPGWTSGPALPACAPQTGTGTLVALSGVLLRPTGPEAGLVVYDRDTGAITCSGPACDTTGAEVVCTDGVITPGLINPHDHLQYNVLAPWQHAELYIDRYDWQSDGDYWDFREAYDAMDDAYVCEIMKWAELRHLASGATAAIGSTGDECIDILARNLDEGEESHGLVGFDLSYSSGRAEYLDATDAADDNADLASGALEAVINHVAEGVDGVGRWELDYMAEIGAVGAGQVYVHATDATVEQLARMAADGTGLIWSPRSNLDLYAGTTLGVVAWRLGVPMALGPDWTWSGSSTVPGELTCAYEHLAAQSAEISDVALWSMVTGDAAAVLGLDGILGTLDVGAKADLAVFPYSAEPYRAVVEAGPEDVQLTVVDGQALYGRPEWVALLAANPDWCETVTACAEERSVCVKAGETGTDADTYADLESALSAALAETVMPAGLEYASELYPIWACAEVREPCDSLAVPGPDDLDGDGVSDATDLCPSAHDPLQTDHDGDGRGDVCDVCPLTAEPTCAHAPDDLDDDGVPNVDDGCPWLADDGADADVDGKPDACDPCPLEANPGDAACTATIAAIQDPAHPSPVAEGESVVLSGVVVTAAGDSGFFVQDPAATEWGGLYIYDAGDALVVPGDVVTVEGVVDEFFDLTELTDAVTTVTGTAAVPAPIVVAACDVGTSGPDAERFESMLVRVDNVAVTDANPDAPSDYDEFEVEGCLRVDDYLCADCWLDQPGVGTAYASITAPLYYSFSNSKLVPRDAADLQ